MSKKSKFTDRQQKFIDNFDGNGTKAARAAGYSGNDNALGVIANGLLRNIKIVEAIKTRQLPERQVTIADRVARQEFWTHVMMATDKPMADRLRASELLAKAEGDFIQQINVKNITTLEDLVDGANERRKK